MTPTLPSRGRAYSTPLKSNVGHMKSVTIDATQIQDESTFHDVFAKTLGFPKFYGRNMDAWIDCMSYVDTPDAGMSTIWVEPGEVLVLSIKDAEGLKQRCPELWLAFLECTAFVNWRIVEKGGPAVLTVAAYA